MKNGTVRPATMRQIRDIASTIVLLTPECSTAEEAELIIGNKGEFLTDMRRALANWLRSRIEEERAEARKVRGKPIPADSEVFELTLDGDDPKNQPFEMVRRLGFDPKNWKFLGKYIRGKQTRKFKLVHIDDCNCIEEICTKLRKYGEIPEGQWMQAFIATYPVFDGHDQIGIAEPSWVSPSGDVNFVTFDFKSSLHFSFSQYAWSVCRRWLVEVR